ncbi:bifunctional metallophosphatase/5'-nucleotidase [Salipaludibacillus daqingensis]|uniref:bifunctional metallophosphatase/5'-nucleotidase n=1 Tax=Salipaludibacillus daqingensis TaxID=3041001 RepID=UPI002474DE20|nr:bifunctional UDP-sugar hydrolase/5'-nucleotidase [Salipaludibacillus daqingensis]
MSNEKLRILHTNDLHSNLEQWPAVTALLKKQRNEARQLQQEVLLFDIGDHCDRVHPMTEALLGKGNVQLLNEMEYDAVTIGNNEGITFSQENLDDLYSDAAFPVILSNLKYNDGSRPSWTIPHKIYHLKSGLKVGVTGVTIPFRLFYETLGWNVTDPFIELEKTVDELRSQVDFLVCLSHLGLHEDEKMAKVFPSFDLILGSHTHHVLNEGKKVNDTWINQSGRSGAYIGDVTVRFEKKENGRHVVEIEKVHSMKVDEAVRDKQTEKTLANLIQEGNRLLEREVTVLDSPLTVDWYKTSPFPVLLSEGVREWCNADISMVNSGVILDNLEQGPVTLSDLHTICPHPINPATVMISGERLLETIRQSQQKEMIHLALKGFGFRGKVIGQMIFDNLEVIGEPRYINETNVLINGFPLIRDQKYKLATLDMFTLGHLYPTISSIREITYYMPEFLRDLIAWKLNQMRE